MSIYWKQQHYNNSCASACLAMLLSPYGIDKEDSDVVKETEMQYLIQLNQDYNSYEAGVLVQGKEYFNLMLNRYNLKLTECKVADWDQYKLKADGLLQEKRPFMTGVNPHYLPNSSTANSQPHSHAIVVYGKDGNYYKCYDPDTGLVRTIEHCFHSIRSVVDLKLSVGQFESAITNKNTGYNYVIGYIEEIDSSIDNTDQIIQESILGISKYKDIAQDKLNEIRLIVDIPNYDDFYNFIKEIVKPIAIYLYNAIKISNTDGSKDEILNLLENYKHTVMNIQDDVRGFTVSNWKVTKSDLIDKISQIQLAIIQHIESR